MLFLFLRRSLDNKERRQRAHERSFEVPEQTSLPPMDHLIFHGPLGQLVGITWFMSAVELFSTGSKRHQLHHPLPPLP